MTFPIPLRETLAMTGVSLTPLFTRTIPRFECSDQDIDIGVLVFLRLKS